MEAVTQKTLLFGQMKYQKGEISLWGNSCFIDPVVGIIIKNKLSEKLGNKPDMLNYFSEKFQANMGVKITGEKFGYAATYKNKKDLLEFSGGQFELLGYGSVQWVEMNFKEERFIVKMKCPYARLYSNLCGPSKTPVDYWNAGGWAGCLEYILGKKVGCIETSCVAQGKPFCEFLIKPLSNWNKKDPLVKKNSFIFENVQLTLGKLRF